MPHMVGTKFYMSIRKEEEYNSIPVIVISGMSAPHKAIPKAVAVLEQTL
jgi:response regulator RpfG family c-di-GMP phosphodiesterase